MTCREAVRKGEEMLAAHHIPDARFDAEQLFFHAAGMDVTAFTLQKEHVLSAEVETKYRSLLERRISGEPLQYILGIWDFYKHSFYVGEGVLIPRPETEELTQLCIDAIRASGYKTVYDLCAGSGCIGISIALACKETQVYLVERYDAAITYLKKNVPPSASERVHVIKRDVFEGADAALPQPQLLVSNPPYIPTSELSALQKEVQKEPVTALDGGADGLDFYRAIAKLWFPSVASGGMLAFECGETQASSVAALFTKSQTKVIKDLYGADRFVTVEK